MPKRLWRQIAIVLVCTFLSGLAVSRGVPVLTAMIAVSGAGLFCVMAMAVLVPLPERDAPQRTSDVSPLPSDIDRHLLEQIPSPLFLLDLRGRVAYSNAAARAMLPRLETGQHYANLFRSPGFLDGVSRIIEGAPDHTVSFAAAYGGVENHISAEMRRLDATDELGGGPYVLIQLSDQTERMATDRMRTDFIANASHELRTPLASIIGYIETLQGHARDDAEARVHFLNTMSQQASRMQRLVEDLMSLSRIEMNAHTAPTTQCNLTDIVREVSEGIRPLAERRDATLDVAVELEESAQVIADRDQLGQVFTNLIENALKYGGTGGTVHVSLSPEDSRFPGMIGVSIKDNGPGIPRQHLHRLTERFYRVNAKQSKEQGGTGLGLAIVKHILARHAGELDITSVVEQGSTFTVWLPLRKLS